MTVAAAAATWQDRAMPWTLDLNTKSATDTRGNRVAFMRRGRNWHAEPHHDAALETWTAALRAGADMLNRAGNILYGKVWKTPLADDLGISRNTPANWIDGTTPFTLDHPIWPRIAALITARQKEANSLLRDLDKAMAKANPPGSNRYAGGGS